MKGVLQMMLQLVDLTAPDGQDAKERHVEMLMTCANVIVTNPIHV